ncbi:MAG: N-acetylmuramoyl-L-alanine amidase, partial [Myxococcaceae bacterium]|nr:N-acetylmuramoyl-L-alanine amidase [Myxococcaceae bacterium]
PALAGPLIVLDPGHGGSQEGAASPAGLKEKHVALQMALLVKAALEKTVKARVRLTREKDQLLQLNERVKWANEQRPDLFVSIHANSMPTRKLRLKTEGIETYFLSAAGSSEQAKKVAARENAELPAASKGPGGDTLSFILADLQRSETHADSSRLAYLVHEKLIGASGAIDRGVQQAPFYVLMGLEAPAVLIEVGFISHPDEAQRLADLEYQGKLAQAIADGVQAFMVQISARDGK